MLINNNLIQLDVELDSKEAVIRYVAEMMDRAGKLNDLEQYIQDVNDREAQISTNLGDGIGMPHARSKAVVEAGLVFLRLKNGIEWEGEGEAVKFVFGIAAPENGGDIHLRILSHLARKLIYDEFKQRLFNASTSHEVLTLLEEATGGLA